MKNLTEEELEILDNCDFLDSISLVAWRRWYNLIDNGALTGYVLHIPKDNNEIYDSPLWTKNLVKVTPEYIFNNVSEELQKKLVFHMDLMC